MMPPSLEQIEALKAFAAKNGLRWKAKLLIDWGREATDETSGPLRRLRNTHGPEWLAYVRLSEYEESYDMPRNGNG